MLSHILGVNRAIGIEIEHGKEITGKENKPDEARQIYECLQKWHLQRIIPQKASIEGRTQPSFEQ